jgi:WD40 repeat protein
VRQRIPYVGCALHSREGHRGTSLSAHTLYTASQDGTLRTWDVDTPESYFVGTEHGVDRFVYVVDGLDLLPLDRFFDRAL